jgi:hypothetical protein
MPRTICVGAYTLRYPEGGAYFWVFLHWALGLRALGFHVTWLDSVHEETPETEIAWRAQELKSRLTPYGMATNVAVVRRDGSPLSTLGCPGVEVLEDSELFINLGYDLAPTILKRSSRSVFVDIDPGLTQTWLREGVLSIAPHDFYLTYGETVGRSGSKVPECGLRWLYTPPPVYVPAWESVEPPADEGAFSTVTSWWGDWLMLGGKLIDNSKRAGFMECLQLPRKTSVKLELAAPLTPHPADIADRELLEENGWLVRDVRAVSSTPQAFQNYVACSQGEFSCLKSGYGLLETGWMTERTLNYLATGRPAIISHTGHSSILPDAEGLFRFRTLDEAATYLTEAQRNLEYHGRAARAIVEEHFAATKVLSRILALVTD